MVSNNVQTRPTPPSRSANHPDTREEATATAAAATTTAAIRPERTHYTSHSPRPSLLLPLPRPQPAGRKEPRLPRPPRRRRPDHHHRLAPQAHHRGAPQQHRQHQPPWHQRQRHRRLQHHAQGHQLPAQLAAYWCVGWWGESPWFLGECAAAADCWAATGAAGIGWGGVADKG